MKKQFKDMLLCFIVVAAFAASVSAADALAVAPSLAALESQFADPPDTFGVNCWWWTASATARRRARSHPSAGP